MPVIPFIPLIAAGVGAAGTAYGAHKASSDAKKARAAQQPLIDAQTRAAEQQNAQGQQLFSFGMPLLQRSGEYYSRLLGGDRASLRLATLPERQEISELYRGAEKGIDRSGVQGANKTVQRAELARERVGKLASLVPNARAAAAGQVGALGQTGVSGGMAGGTAGANIYSQLMSGQLGRDQLSLQARQYSDQQSQAMGQQLGQMLTLFGQYWQNRKTAA